MQFKSSQGDENSALKIKLKAGESVVGVLRGEIVDFKRPFNEGDKPSFRFQVNMIVKIDGRMQALILENGWKLYQGLASLQQGGWDLEKVYVKISRAGSTKNDTVYTATVLPQQPDAATLAEIAKIQLNTLYGQSGPAPSSQPANDDSPF